MNGTQGYFSIPTIIEDGVVYDTNKEKAELFSKQICCRQF